ncbi:LamG domain-containing protein [Sagittula salina]|uniref:LamG domain-containing protein n=1 Tax=Sagittula salina TaxID=2820268 RepID=A0A940S1Z2_9RHOB|nr:LamG domain-containing protein [Sagittula salina]MBP0484683.1 LamG domain-containing protein [Sagittula salina]
MTVEAQVANLVTAVDQLTDAVKVRKAVFDAAVLDAGAARDQAASYVPQVTALRDTAQSLRDQTYGLAQDVASAIVYQNLEAVAASKAVNPTAICIDDTVLPMWAQIGKSWYNEPLGTATRGTRRDMPRVKVIVSTGAALTIYDGDDPSLPMWMVFEASNSKAFRSGANSVSSMNGVVAVGVDGTSSGLLLVIDFAADRLAQRFAGFSGVIPRVWRSVSSRNGGEFESVNLPDIVQRDANAVGMTVFPGAPLSPFSGLPVPTIAVATGGGVSIIKHDGTVVNSLTSTPAKSVTWAEGALVWQNLGRYIHSARLDELSSSGFGAQVARTAAAAAGEFQMLCRVSEMTSADHGVAYGGSAVDLAVAGLCLRQKALGTGGMSALLTTTFNTGWMPDGIEGAWLADTATATLSGTSLVDGGSTWEHLTTNTGWSGSGDTVSFGGTGAVQYNKYFTRMSSVPTGQMLKYTFTIENLSGSSVNVGLFNTSSKGFQEPQNTFSSNGTYTRYRAAEDGAAVGFCVQSNDPTQTVTVSNVSIELADADRSIAANHLSVVGTINRTPVATGSELVGYGGFSPTNYLIQDYDSDLDFGTGDFSILVWSKGAATDSIVVRQDKDASAVYGAGNYFRLYLVGGLLRAFVNGSSLTAPFAVTTTDWHQFAWTREAGVSSLYHNGVKVASSGSLAGSVTNANAVLRVGVVMYNGGFVDAHDGALALFRIGASALTADQIAHAYRTERPMFEPGAQVTLGGASAAVTALAHDADTGLLHVGTNQGRSAFRGLVRSEYEAGAVTKLAARGGMTIKGDAA